jgi:hypothetical protein
MEGESSMHKKLQRLALAATCAAALITAPVLYAHAAQGSSGAMMSHWMMGDQNSRDGGGGLMMGMMKRMNRMMEDCSNMMSDTRPNDRWRKDTPPEPDK